MTNSSEKTTSFFEFWPTKLMYTPVAIKWLLLSIRYGSLTLPLIANPRLTLSGMVGVAKSELMQQAQGLCESSILKWKKFIVDDTNPDTQAHIWIQSVQKMGIDLPFVCKPDIGCRGSGVKLIHNHSQLTETIASYPLGSALLIQKLANYQSEAGIFYVKMPGAPLGKVVSLTIKHSPTVVGDGKLTLKQLLEKDPRAKNLLHLYQGKNQTLWNQVIAKDEKHNLLFSASHCHGAIFEDARKHITPELSQAIELMMQGLPEFHYGRLDVKFKDLEQLKKGKTIEIIEINGASAESIHIWDKRSTFFEAIKTLMWQYTSLFKIGAYQRSLGYKTPGLIKLYKHWKIEKKLSNHYPDTD